MNRRIINAALMVVLLVALVFVASQAISGARQVTNPAASTLDVSDDQVTFLFLPPMSQTQLFIGLVLFTFVSLVGFTGGLAFLLFYLNREVNESAEEEGQPTNPLSYDTYGHFAGGALVIVLTLLVAFFLMGTGLLPVQASEQATLVDHLFNINFILIAIFFGLVAGLFIHFLIYYRARPGDESDGVFIHGDFKLEVLWTVGPALIVLVLAIVAGAWLNDMEKPQDGEQPVQVTGFQWDWVFEYPMSIIPEDLRDQARGPITSSQLVLMQGQPYIFEMTATDVVHSFWVPEMRIKRDVVPGVITELRVTPSEVGEYKVRCAELCGTRHHAMRADVIVLNEADYRDWVIQSLQAQQNPVLAGQNVYEQRCANCHTLDGERLVGPTWQDLYLDERELDDGSTIVADEAYLRDSIFNPNDEIVEGFAPNVMPANFDTELTDTEVDQVIQFIKAQTEAGRQELLEEGVDLSGLDIPGVDTSQMTGADNGGDETSENNADNGDSE